LSSRIIVSSTDSSDWDSLTDFTWPSARAYAKKVNAAFFGRRSKHPCRPASWSKLSSIAWGLSFCDEVLWLDADVDVRLATDDVFSELPAGESAGMCFLTDENRDSHFNCGVILCRRKFLRTLVDAAMCDQFAQHSRWEQEAINWLAGQGLCSLHRLDVKWNAWRGSMPENKQFLHACGIGEVGAKLEWLRSAT
jgi:hypothetical protein